MIKKVIMKREERLRLVRRVDQNFAGETTDKLVRVNRVAKVVKGGRRFSFSALVVVGNQRGAVGYGLGKAGEVPDAISKATAQAKKNMIRVPFVGSTIPHDVIGKFGPSTVIMKPAKPGTGVIAGSAVRAIVEAVGIKDIRTKVIGSNGSHNVIHATIAGLLNLREPEKVAAVRGKSLDELGYAAY